MGDGLASLDAHLSDDKAVAKMGNPVEFPSLDLGACLGRLHLLENEVAGGFAGGDLDPVGNAGGDVEQLAGVEDLGSTAGDAVTLELAKARAEGVLRRHGAAVDDGHRARADEDLVGPILVELGLAGVGTVDEDDPVGALVLDGLGGVAVGCLLRLRLEAGLELGEVRGGVRGGRGRQRRLRGLRRLGQQRWGTARKGRRNRDLRRKDIRGGTLLWANAGTR